MSNTSKYGFPLSDDEAPSHSTDQTADVPEIDLVSMARELDPKIRDILRDFLTAYARASEPRVTFVPNPPDGSSPGWDALADDDDQYAILSFETGERGAYISIRGPVEWTNRNGHAADSPDHPLHKLGQVIQDQTGLTCEIIVNEPKVISAISTEGGPSMGIDTQA